MGMFLGFSSSKISTRSTLVFSFFFVAVLVIASSIATALIPPTFFNANAAYTKAVPAAAGPTINEPNLKAEVVVKGFHLPTSMAFLGPNDILVLEKNSGNVLRIVDGHLLKKTAFTR